MVCGAQRDWQRSAPTDTGHGGLCRMRIGWLSALTPDHRSPLLAYHPQPHALLTLPLRSQRRSQRNGIRRVRAPRRTVHQWKEPPGRISKAATVSCTTGRVVACSCRGAWARLRPQGMQGVPGGRRVRRVQALRIPRWGCQRAGACCSQGGDGGPFANVLLQASSQPEGASKLASEPVANLNVCATCGVDKSKAPGG